VADRSLFENPGVKPLSDQTVDAAVVHPVPHHLPQPLMIQCSEEVFDVGIEYPSNPSHHDGIL
jgi:hypothetical protein